MAESFVAVLMGSDSDLPRMEEALGVLRALEIPFEARILSAHRTPDATHEYVRDADRRGCAVFIAAAGMAAHLAGTVAGLTIRPVIGVPLDAGPLQGLDALLSTVQMPGGIPVACVAVGKAGARNAGYLAAQILALEDAQLAARLRADREGNAAQVLEKDRRLQSQVAR
jgi:5-(carboxyamino)imidazole ribonucleotide mutase